MVRYAAANQEVHCVLIKDHQLSSNLRQNLLKYYEISFYRKIN